MEQKVDGATYYGYLFQESKEPTEVFDALLRSIANYIIEFIGDKDTRNLSPPKLAAFYKAVGGNYDALFVDVPNPNISFIYQSVGCQHSLLPTANDFDPPSIPALTIRGFVRWESIETLLAPEEHVPFLQAALRNFDIKHPDTGEPFPVDLPKESFPLHPDPEIERWHQEGGKKLWRQATLDDDYSTPPAVPPRPKAPSSFYMHVRPPSSPGRVSEESQEDADYSSSRRHVPTRAPVRTPTCREPNYQAHLSPDPSNSEGSPRPSRERTVPDNGHGASHAEPALKSNSPHLEDQPPSADRIRRHSHPRHSTSSSSSGSDTDHNRGNTSTSPTPRTRQSRVYFKGSPKRHVASPSATPFVDPLPASRRFRDIDSPYNRGRSTSYKTPVDPAHNNFASFVHPSRHAPPLRSDSRASMDAVDNPRDKERNRRDEWARVVKVRSGSHDGRYFVRETDRRERERDRDWDVRSDRNEREYERRRTRRTPSPTRTGWRRFVPGLN